MRRSGRRFRCSALDVPSRQQRKDYFGNALAIEVADGTHPDFPVRENITALSTASLPPGLNYLDAFAQCRFGRDEERITLNWRASDIYVLLGDVFNENGRIFDEEVTHYENNGCALRIKIFSS